MGCLCNSVFCECYPTRRLKAYDTGSQKHIPKMVKNVLSQHTLVVYRVFDKAIWCSIGPV